MEAVGKQQTILADWHRGFKQWDFSYYALGSLTVIFSALLAAKPFDAGEGFYRSVACLMTISTGLFGFLNPGERGDRFRRAWSLLSVELTRYESDKTYTVDHVLNAYIQGEAIIHETPAPTPQQIINRAKDDPPSAKGDAP